MASAIGSGGTKLASLPAFRRRIAPALAQHSVVPLLVLRLPELEQIAWRKGIFVARRLERDAARSFRATARRIVRQGDTVGHDTGSDYFLIALLNVSREDRAPSTADCRAALEHISVAMSRQTRRRMEGGWWTLGDSDDLHDLNEVVSFALARGARERERYEFLATLSHELRASLTWIRSHFESVLENGGDLNRSRRYLETAATETLRLGRIVDGLLEFSLLDRSPSSLAVATTDTCEQIRAAIEPLSSRRGVKITAILPPVMHARIGGDACMHALLNLLDNAIAHGDENGNVRIACSAVAGYVEIGIENEGAWVEHDSARGHGLGLSIARTIAERAGGEIRIEHAPDRVRAVLRLPAATDAAGRRSHQLRRSKNT